MRNICVVTGTRAEYGLASSVLKAIKDHPKLTLSLVVTGMHLMSEFGSTIEEIKKDGFEIKGIVKAYPKEDTGKSMAKAFGECIIGLTDVIEKIRPDIVFALTDLGHTLATALAGMYLNIPVAHLHGGDSAKGGFDEYFRHSTTKIANIHFPVTKKSAERIIKMGEDPKYVFNVGAPGLDYIVNKKTDVKKIAEKYNIDLDKPVILMVQHPVTTEIEKAEEQINETMKVIEKLKYQTIIIYPNADAGGRKMIEVIKEYEHYDFIQTYKSIPRDDYIDIMCTADVMVGNSSSGIIEAPSAGIPVVNIGIRQEERERAVNVIDVEPKKEEILKAINKSLSDKEFIKEVKKKKSPYGDGKTGIRIAKILSEITLDKKLIQKKITY